MTTTDGTEQALVASAIKGDRQALAALWSQHRRWVAAILLVYKPRSVEVEDLLQEVAMTMVSRISMLRDTTSLRPWLRTVAMNAARASARGRNVREPAASLDEEVLRTPTDTAEKTSEDFGRVQEAIAALPELYR
ncbi:MAG TPA: sigma-70 family RNA polymerase sigma factor, partial [Phycisphaerales bacterium]|nr:sigma-70 family RNA polymerase sigma factor [Phycisphaerales bacterium]